VLLARRPRTARCVVMSGRRIRYFVTAIAGIVAAATPLWWFATAAGAWDHDERRAMLSGLPFGWWMIFGGIAIPLDVGRFCSSTLRSVVHPEDEFRSFLTK